MTDLPATRNSLILELGRCSDAAWSEFLEVYEHAILGYCIRRGLQQADALDAAQAVFAAVHQKVATWDVDSSKGSFRAWLFRVARNVTVDQITARSKVAASGTDTRTDELLSQVQDHRESNPPFGGDDDSTAFRLELRRSLFEWACGQVQSEVRPVTWQAFQRCAIEGGKPDEVAQELKVPVGTVYTAKCRVMARIRDRVESWDPEQL
ncbi:MAG: sigma-70 family RNA polymerase sigma factor [Planctomycetota bacterium]